MLVMFQPTVLREMGAHKSFRDRGLLGRFIFCICRDNVGTRKPRAPAIPASVKRGYADMLGNLARLPIVRECTEHDDPDAPTGPVIPNVLRLTGPAIACFAAWMQELESAQAPGEELEHLRDWASKAHGHTLRIGGGLHLAEHHAHARPWEIPVSEASIGAAVEIARFYLAHAKVAYRLMGENPVIAGALRILRYIREKRLDTITKRDLHRALQGYFARAADLDEPLKVLEERHYVRPQQPEGGGGRAGRPSSPTYEISPYLNDEIDTIDTNPPAGISVNNVNSVSGVDPGDEPPGGDGPGADEGVVRF